MPYSQHTYSFPMLALSKQLAMLLTSICVYCLVVGYLLRWENVQVQQLGAEAGLINSLILGMLMGFRNRAAYDRWWEGRRLWGQLINDSRNLAWKLQTFVPDEAAGKVEVGEMLANFAEALKQHLRGPAPNVHDFPLFKDVQQNPANVPSFIAGQIYARIAAWKRQGLVDEPTLRILDPHARALLDICGACERIKNTPLSASYKSLLRAGIAVNIVLSPWYTMTETGMWGIPVFLLVCFFLLGVELIDTHIEEPFGLDRDDLELDQYCRTIRMSILQVFPTAEVGPADLGSVSTLAMEH